MISTTARVRRWWRSLGRDPLNTAHIMIDMHYHRFRVWPNIDKGEIYSLNVVFFKLCAVLLPSQPLHVGTVDCSLHYTRLIQSGPHLVNLNLQAFVVVYRGTSVYNRTGNIDTFYEILEAV